MTLQNAPKIDDAVTSIRARWLAEVGKTDSHAENSLALLRIVFEQEMTPSEFLQQAYQLILKRSIDASGIESRLSAASAGTLGRIQIVQELASSDEYLGNTSEPNDAIDLIQAMASMHEETQASGGSILRKRAKVSGPLDRRATDILARVAAIMESQARSQRLAYESQGRELHRLRVRQTLLERALGSASKGRRSRSLVPGKPLLVPEDLTAYASEEELGKAEEACRLLNDIERRPQRVFLYVENSLSVCASYLRLGFQLVFLYADESEANYWEQLGIRSLIKDSGPILGSVADNSVELIRVDNAIEAADDSQLERFFADACRILVAGGVMWIDLSGFKGVGILRLKAAMALCEQVIAAFETEVSNEDSWVLRLQRSGGS